MRGFNARDAIVLCILACTTAVASALLPAGADADEIDAISRGAVEYYGGSTATGEIYSQCLLSTMRYDVTLAPDETSYVITGDIGAMWLRDSSAQMRPYLFFSRDSKVGSMLRGLIARQAEDMSVDPYANAFNRDYKVTEEKYELDSLIYPITLAWTYWKETGDAAAFRPAVKAGYERAVSLMELERDHSKSRYRHRELPQGGAGSPVGYTGMVWTGFRASDDRTKYGYHIPEEMFAAVGLGELAQLEDVVWHDPAQVSRVEALRAGIIGGINTYGIVYVPGFGYIYAYEVDGLGHANLMDDANIPSLLSIPYFGYVPAGDPIYKNTRRFVLSPQNPYYFAGTAASGVGSPHTPHGYVWPLSLIVQGLTSEEDAELAGILSELERSDTGEHLLHESFDANDPAKYTRSNFGWACALYAELIRDRVMREVPLPMWEAAGE
ncbi:MAG: glycoside hydrolase family 125 protein [Candidatus Eremiobacteraeota bacterium]|nr:glycoside hydrolase family 125 protein [Candidatus Eremiobacteraeota bacterium]